MKKLKGWQIALLVIFYPVGIVYLLVWLLNRSKTNTDATAAQCENAVKASDLRVLRDFRTKIVGVTFGNDDGSSRQKIIAGCKIGQGVVFRPMNDPQHPESIGVFTENGQQLGHLAADLSQELREKYSQNPMQAEIENITGGDGYNYGCNLHITIYKMPSEYKKQETVFVVKGGRVYHSVPMCFNSDDFEEITIEQAKKKGLTPCKKCYKV